MYQKPRMLFGQIVPANGISPSNQMQLSPMGEIAITEWLKTFEMRTDMNLRMGEFVVMPNHFHAIIVIGENEYNQQNSVRASVDRCCISGCCRDAMHCVSTGNTGNNNGPKNKFAPQSKNLASIVRGFKMAVTTYARKNHIDFAWQPRFHDHIIRSEDEWDRIADYIKNNVNNWDIDKFSNKEITTGTT